MQPRATVMMNSNRTQAIGRGALVDISHLRSVNACVRGAVASGILRLGSVLDTWRIVSWGVIYVYQPNVHVQTIVREPGSELGERVGVSVEGDTQQQPGPSRPL